jgi:hypothetical protein
MARNARQLAIPPFFDERFFSICKSGAAINTRRVMEGDGT